MRNYGLITQLYNYFRKQHQARNITFSFIPVFRSPVEGPGEHVRKRDQLHQRGQHGK